MMNGVLFLLLLLLMQNKQMNDFFPSPWSLMIDRQVDFSCMENNLWHFNTKVKLAIHDIGDS